MASYQPQHPQQPGRRTDVRRSVHSLDSSWIIAELARATNENVFSDTVSSPLSATPQSASPESELWASEEVSSDTHFCHLFLMIFVASWPPRFYDSVPYT